MAAQSSSSIPLSALWSLSPIGLAAGRVGPIIQNQNCLRLGSFNWSSGQAGRSKLLLMSHELEQLRQHFRLRRKFDLRLNNSQTGHWKQLSKLSELWKTETHRRCDDKSLNTRLRATGYCHLVKKGDTAAGEGEREASQTPLFARLRWQVPAT